MNKSIAKSRPQESISQLILPIAGLVLAIFFAVVSQSRPTGSEDTLFQFKGISVPYDIIVVTEEELHMLLELELSYLEAYMDKQPGSMAEDGDRVKLQYMISGQAPVTLEKYILGSGEFGEDFDEQLIGMYSGEEKTFSIRKEGVPESTQYTVTLLHIQSLSDSMTEEIAQTHYGCTASEAIAKLVRETEEERIWEYIYPLILENSAIVIPEAACELYVQSCFENLQQETAALGMSLEEYLQENEIDMETLRMQFTDSYVEMILFERLTKQEGKDFTTQDMHTYLERLSAQYKMSPDTILWEYGEDYIYYSMRLDYIKSLAVSSAVITYEEIS